MQPGNPRPVPGDCQPPKILSPPIHRRSSRLSLLHLHRTYTTPNPKDRIADTRDPRHTHHSYVPSDIAGRAAANAISTTFDHHHRHLLVFHHHVTKPSHRRRDIFSCLRSVSISPSVHQLANHPPYHRDQSLRLEPDEEKTVTAIL
ncbi:hypothetical protein VTJ04DRAFT_7714 [Mycothermus thermophilus]|uniref:uncharacterized protein n=1 Tax=Humicola insolens TaxID=85995 RepID=UPI0037433F7A